MLYAEDILNKSSTTNKRVTITDITKGTLTGAGIGLVGGAMYAYSKEKKYSNCMLIGAFAGGLISRIFLI